MGLLKCGDITTYLPGSPETVVFRLDWNESFANCSDNLAIEILNEDIAPMLVKGCQIAEKRKLPKSLALKSIKRDIFVKPWRTHDHHVASNFFKDHRRTVEEIFDIHSVRWMNDFIDTAEEFGGESGEAMGDEWYILFRAVKGPDSNTKIIPSMLAFSEVIRNVHDLLIPRTVKGIVRSYFRDNPDYLEDLDSLPNDILLDEYIGLTLSSYHEFAREKVQRRYDRRLPKLKL